MSGQGDLFGSLGAARRDYWHAALNGGGTCPCCDRFGKVYRRKLNKGMATSLIWLYLHARTYVDVPKVAPRYVVASRELGKLAHWSLAENKPNEDDPSKKHTGLWAITTTGLDFVEGRITVPSHCYLYDNEVLSFSESHITISEALKRPFDYRELMDD